MAQRRMFSIQITGSDAFLDLPAKSQLLYFHLNMAADDDGFVGNPKKTARTIKVASKNIDPLIESRFILPFTSGVVVVKHWKMHNYIQNDRYHKTKYVDELKHLIEKDNGSYTERVHDGYNPLPEVSLGKSSLGLNSSESRSAMK